MSRSVLFVDHDPGILGAPPKGGQSIDLFRRVRELYPNLPLMLLTEGDPARASRRTVAGPIVVSLLSRQSDE